MNKLQDGRVYKTTGYSVVAIPFKGYVETNIITIDNMQYTQYGDSLECYQCDGYQIVDSVTLQCMFRDNDNSYITQPKTITQSRYNDMLEVLPPMNWHRIGAIEVFCMTEMYSGNITTWFVKKCSAFSNNSMCIEFMNSCKLSDNEITAIVDNSMLWGK